MSGLSPLDVVALQNAEMTTEEKVKFVDGGIRVMYPAFERALDLIEESFPTHLGLAGDTAFQRQRIAVHLDPVGTPGIHHFVQTVLARHVLESVGLSAG